MRPMWSVVAAQYQRRATACNRPLEERLNLTKNASGGGEKGDPLHLLMHYCMSVRLRWLDSHCFELNVVQLGGRVPSFHLFTKNPSDSAAAYRHELRFKRPFPYWPFVLLGMVVLLMVVAVLQFRWPSQITEAT